MKLILKNQNILIVKQLIVKLHSNTYKKYIKHLIYTISYDSYSKAQVEFEVIKPLIGFPIIKDYISSMIIVNRSVVEEII